MAQVSNNNQGPPRTLLAWSATFVLSRSYKSAILTGRQSGRDALAPSLLDLKEAGTCGPLLGTFHLITQFLTFDVYRNAESDSSSSSGSDDEEEKKAASSDGDDNQISSSKPLEESAAQKKQREMIEKQRKAQAEALEKHKVKVQEEEKKKAEEAAQLDNNRENRIDLADLK